MGRVCTQDGCQSIALTRGLCNKHYLRARYRGELPNLNKTTESRFWEKVEKAESCWNWTGAKKTKAGYGGFYYDGKVGFAHRYSYELHNGPIPAGMHIDHKCRVPSCVNPSHLQCVSPSLNGQNRKGAAADSTTGIRGVGWSKARKKWRAYAGIGGRYLHFGYFDDINDAADAAKIGRNQFFANSLADRDHRGV